MESVAPLFFKRDEHQTWREESGGRYMSLGTLVTFLVEHPEVEWCIGCFFITTKGKRYTRTAYHHPPFRYHIFG